MAYYARVIALTGLLGLTILFLTGCFDVSTEITINSPDSDAHVAIRIVTPSETAFEAIKSYLFKEDMIGPDKSRDHEVSLNKQEGIYSILLEKSASISEINSYPANIKISSKEKGGITYRITELHPPEEERQEEEYEEWFEGYNYSFVVHLPNNIQEAWWIDPSGEKIADLNPTSISGSTLRVEAPINKIMGIKDEWEEREGLVILTEK